MSILNNNLIVKIHWECKLKNNIMSGLDGDEVINYPLTDILLTVN